MGDLVTHPTFKGVILMGTFLAGLAAAYELYKLVNKHV